jgi:hypothetical protein
MTRVLTIGFLVATVSACAAKSGDAVELNYTVEFPSKSAAVATEGVQLYAFAGRLDCVSLIKGYGPPPTWPNAPVAQTASVSPCALGQTPLSVPFGDYTFLAIASREGKELLIGCAPQTLDGKNQTLKVPLAPFALDRVIPQTSCNLSEKCAGRSCTN